MKEKFYTVIELGRVFGVTRQTIHNWYRHGRFPNSFTVGDKKTILIPASDAERVRKEEEKKARAELVRIQNLNVYSTSMGDR